MYPRPALNAVVAAAENPGDAVSKRPFLLPECYKVVDVCFLLSYLPCDPGCVRRAA